MFSIYVGVNVYRVGYILSLNQYKRSQRQKWYIRAVLARLTLALSPKTISFTTMHVKMYARRTNVYGKTSFKENY